MKIVFSKHAETEIQSRKIEKRFVIKTLKNPQQKFKKDDRWIYQSKYIDEHLKKEMLLRVFLVEHLKGLKIITVYKTSKISKYWKV